MSGTLTDEGGVKRAKTFRDLVSEKERLAEADKRTEQKRRELEKIIDGTAAPVEATNLITDIDVWLNEIGVVNADEECRPYIPVDVLREFAEQFNLLARRAARCGVANIFNVRIGYPESLIEISGRAKYARNAPELLIEILSAERKGRSIQRNPAAKERILETLSEKCDVHDLNERLGRYESGHAMLLLDSFTRIIHQLDAIGGEKAVAEANRITRENIDHLSGIEKFKLKNRYRAAQLWIKEYEEGKPIGLLKEMRGGLGRQERSKEKKAAKENAKLVGTTGDLFGDANSVKQSDLKIWFCTVVFNQQVHATGLGFTNQIYAHVQAPNEHQAKLLVTEKYEKKGISVKSVQVKHALQQGLDAYIPGSVYVWETDLRAQLDRDDDLMGRWLRSEVADYSAGFQSHLYRNRYREMHDAMLSSCVSQYCDNDKHYDEGLSPSL